MKTNVTLQQKQKEFAISLMKKLDIYQPYIDIFEKDGVYYFSEVNPRFGGGYPHAYVCGADHMTLIKNNLCGKINKKKIGEYAVDKVMMKYNEIMLMDAVTE